MAELAAIVRYSLAPAVRADDGPDGGSSAPSRPGPLVSSGGGLRTSLEGEPLPAAGAGASGAHTLDPNDGTAR